MDRMLLRHVFGRASSWLVRAGGASNPNKGFGRLMNSLTRDQLGLMFHKVVDTCEKKLYDPKLNGVNWRHLAEQRKERILAAASDEELEREFNELIKELKVSHAGFFHEKRPRARGRWPSGLTLL